MPQRVLFTSLLLTALVSGAAIAQTTPPSADTQPPAPERNTQTVSSSAADLAIPARATAGYNTSGGGYDGFTSLEGFVPLFQTPGQRLTFLNSRFLIDNEGNIGGSVLLGHRFYDADANRIWGGYLAYDNRQTSENTFHQIGFGLESLGAVWDFRFNAYLPVGDTRQLVDQQSSSSLLQSSTGFQGNLFVINSLVESQRLQTFEAAAGGFDLEAGARLAHWRDGDLRGYAGIYYYDPPQADGALGWRLRLSADLNRSINLGIAAQGDELFGTNLLFSVAFSLPGVRSNRPLDPTTLVQQRLGAPIARIAAIALDYQTDIQSSIEQVSIPLMNPEEEQAYRFWHVTLGTAAGGDGTFERPFSTLQEALNATLSDGNDIVYVDAGTNPNIPAFTIPDRVQVLSQGPVQVLAGLPFPGFPESTVRLPFSPIPNYSGGVAVQLPFSGDGNFPLIQQAGAANLVTLGNRTVLAGFNIAGAGSNGILGNGVANVELRDNRITNSGDRGVFLNNVTGSVVMFDNIITGSQGGASSGQGLFIQNSTTNTVEVTIARQQFDNQRVGIELAALGDRALNLTPEQIVAITNTTINNSSAQGLLVRANETGNQQVRFENGEIDNSGSQGVFIQATNTGSQEVRLQQNTIRNSGGAGLEVLGGTLGGSSTAAQEVFIRGNTIENNAGAGIAITGNELVAQEFGIDDNTIRNNGGPGITAVANNASFQEYVTDINNNSQGVGGNVISRNNGPGIVLQSNDASTVVADIQQNQLSNNQTAGAEDLTVTATNSATSVCVVLLGNVSQTGIRLDNNSVNASPGLFKVGDLSNVSANNVGGIAFLPNLAAFTDRPGVRSCF